MKPEKPLMTIELPRMTICPSRCVRGGEGGGVRSRYPRGALIIGAHHFIPVYAWTLNGQHTHKETSTHLRR